MPKSPRRYLLAVGIESYAEWPRLSNAPQELERITSLLTSPPFEFERILQPACESPHTEDLITQLIKWANSPQRLPTDQLIIYWTGHGEVYREELHLVLRNSIRRPLIKTILARELIESALSDRRSSGGTLLLLDVCYSGQGPLDIGQRLGAIDRAFPSANMPEFAIFSASRSREEARQNAFSEAFVRALRQCQLDAQEHEPQLYLHKLLEHIADGMPEDQTPVLFNRLSKVRFFANPIYEMDPSRRSDANGLMGRIRRFEAEYLIGENNFPVPFGGRQDEMHHLSRWLFDPQADSRLIITAPLGRGKSALLVQWIESLRLMGQINKDGWSLAFLPISLRFETSVPHVHFRLLAMQLADISCEKLGKPPADAAEYYSDQCRELLCQLALSGKRVLVVLDGLDEAVSPGNFGTIFPKDPPETLRVVASARLQVEDCDFNGWLKRLEWPNKAGHHLALPTLTPNQIADVFVRMGAPIDIVAQEPEMISRLGELSEGEPLTVRFLAEDLWNKTNGTIGIRRTDLDALKPGFAPYFDHSLELQKKQWEERGEQINFGVIDRILAVLSVAKAPITGIELLAIFRYTFPNEHCPPTSRQLLEPLRRFVFGDGRRIPYVLAHPKIGEVLREGRCHDLLTEVNRGFAKWAQHHVSALNERTLGPEDASAYALQFTRCHFQDARASVDMLMQLVENGWRRAWEYFEGGHRGFADDVQAVLNSLLINHGIAHIHLEWRCALTLSSIQSLGSAIPPVLVTEAVKLGIISLRHGHYLAERIADDESAVSAIMGLAMQCSTDAELCGELVSSAIQRAIGARSSRDGHPLILILRKLLDPALGLLSDSSRRSTLELIRSTAERLPNAADRCKIFLELAIHSTALDGERILPALMKSAHECRGYSRHEMLALIASDINVTLIPSALDTARQINDKDFVHDAIWCLERRSQFATSSVSHISAALSLETAERKCRALIRLIPDLSERERRKALTHLLDNLEALPPSEVRWELFKPALAYVPSSVIVDVLDSETLNASAYTIAQMLSDIVRNKGASPSEKPTLPNDLADKLLQVAKSIDDERWRSDALVQIAPHLPPDYTHDALIISGAIEDDRWRSEALSALASCLLAESQALAFEFILEIKDERYRSNALIALAAHLRPGPLVDTCLSLAPSFRDEWQRFELLATLLPSLSFEQNHRLSGELIEIAAAMDHQAWRLSALEKLAPHIPVSLIEEALKIANTIEMCSWRTKAIVPLTLRLPAEDRGAALHSALMYIGEDTHYDREIEQFASNLPSELVIDVYHTARTISDEWLKAAALIALAPGLPVEMVAEFLGSLTAFADHELSELLVERAWELPLESVGEAIALTYMMNDDGSRCKTLTALSFHAPDEYVQDILNGIMAIDREYHCSEALAAIAWRLPDQLLCSVADVVCGFEDAQIRCGTLLVLGLLLESDNRRKILAEALRSGKIINSASQAARALATLAQLKGPGGKQTDTAKALFAVSQIQHERARKRAMIDILPMISYHSLEPALEVLLSIKDEDELGDALVSIAPYLTRRLRTRAFHAAQAMRSKRWRENTLARLSPYLSKEQRKRTPDLMFTITGDCLQFPSFFDEIKRFKDGFSSQSTRKNISIFEAVKGMPPHREKCALLCAIFPLLPINKQGQCMISILESVIKLERHTALECISVLASNVWMSAAHAAVDSLMASIEDVSEWYP